MQVLLDENKKKCIQYLTQGCTDEGGERGQSEVREERWEGYGGPGIPAEPLGSGAAF